MCSLAGAWCRGGRGRGSPYWPLTPSSWPDKDPRDSHVFRQWLVLASLVLFAQGALGIIPTVSGLQSQLQNPLMFLPRRLRGLDANKVLDGFSQYPRVSKEVCKLAYIYLALTVMALRGRWVY